MPMKKVAEKVEDLEMPPLMSSAKSDNTHANTTLIDLTEFVKR